MQPVVVQIEHHRARARAAAAGERVDLYAPIHKGLRAFFGATLDAAGRMDALDPADVASTVGQVRSLLGFLRLHLHVENQFLHPALEARRPGAARQTTHDHVEHEQAIERLEGLLLAVERAEDGARSHAAFELYRALAAFAAENYTHMELEETANNAQLWADYTDAELLEIHAALVAAVSPQDMALVLRWMIPALAPAERAGMLTEMQQKLPAEAFAGVLELVYPHLTSREWAKVTAALGPLGA